MALLSHSPTPVPDRGAVLTKALLRASDRLGLSARHLSQVIGVSEASVSRMKRGDFALEYATKPFELAALLVRVFRSLDAIAGGDEQVIQGWMGADNSALNGVPGDKIKTIAGLGHVIAYLDARRAVL